MKNYIDIKNSSQKLELHVYYSLGGMGYFDYKVKKRGYYLAVTPVTISEDMLSFTAFSGVSTLLLETKRKSDKSYKEACTLADSKKQELIDHVLDKLDETRNGKQVSKEIGISIPPRYYALSKDEILGLPVQVVTIAGYCEYPDLETAKRNHNLNSLNGALYGQIKGMDALRFEDSATSKALSE